jgi:GNAT superfamily N-acetyltransferase
VMTVASTPTLRNLQPADAAAAMQLSIEAGWNQTEDDWRMLIELAPQGCLAIELDGEIASTATLVCYGRRLAWIGMVLTRIAQRGKGFARRLLTETLVLADQLGIESVKLDATDQGQPLYEKLGFRCEQPVERWWANPTTLVGNATPSRISPVPPGWHTADQRAFGADRTALLENLARRNAPLTSRDSYLLTRPGRVTSYLGPGIASSASSARALVERALQQPATGGWFWDLLIDNSDAVALARDFGFAPKRHLMRMVRGKDRRGEESSIYAIAGFELG